MDAIADTEFSGYVAHEFAQAADPFTGLCEAVRICSGRRETFTPGMGAIECQNPFLATFLDPLHRT